jgi:multidrug efflux pump subunit AcrA (membrane-fusion protein)
MTRWSPAKIARIAVPIVAVLGGGAFFGFKKLTKRPSTEPPSDVAEIKKGDLEVHFSDSGELKPKRAIDIASKPSGRITSLAVEEGQRVRKGQKLAVVQPGRSEAEHYEPYVVASPIEGVVMRYQQEGQYQQDSKLVKPGDYVKGILESNPPDYLMTVADLSKLVVRMKISEMDILKLHEGMAVDVTVDAIPGETFPAKVSLVSPQAEKDQNNLKNFRVEVLLLKVDPRLKPGMTARVDGLLQAHKGVLKIPLAAVFEEQGGKTIAYVEQPDGKAKKTPIKIGLRNETDAELLEGLSAGQRVKTEKPVELPKT